MQIQLFHNKILKNTITDGFSDSVCRVLVPLVHSVRPDADGILMYEDHIADGFLFGGEWYYPLTVLSGDVADTLWIKWAVNKKHFTGGCPYAYVGEGCIDFTIAEDVPSAFLTACEGRRIAPYTGAITIDVDAEHPDPLFLSGRYSQSFIDELAYQITHAIEYTAEVSGVAKSSIALSLIFAPGTYMEHTSEGVTYRRLLISAKGCQFRDLWVKWTVKGEGKCTVQRHLKPGEVEFELGEGVPQRIREKEYRYLAVSNPDKYRSAMGKKTATEWREIIKRAQKRGELEAMTYAPIKPFEYSDEDTSALEEAFIASLMSAQSEEAVEEKEESFDELMALARATFGDPEEAPAESAADTTAPDPEEDELMAMLKRVINGERSEPEEQTSEEEIYEEEAEESVELDEEIEELEEADKPEALTEEELLERFLSETLALEDEEIENGEQMASDVNEEEAEIYDEPSNEDAQPCEQPKTEEDALAKIEAKIRLEYEAKARAKAEEARELKLERERLLAECDRLSSLAKAAEERLAHETNARIEEQTRSREEANRRDMEEDRLRREIEAREAREARERERLAEAARIAVEEQRRLEAERLERERIASEAEAIRRRAEEEANAEEERRREVERIQRSTQAPTPVAEKASPSTVNRRATLMFRRSPDPSIAGSIHRIVEDTLVKQGKEHIHMRMKAQLRDSTIILDIINFPEDENELLINIIKAIGNGNLGITKIILE